MQRRGEQTRRRKKEGLGVLKKAADTGQKVMIPRESYVYAVYVHPVEEQAQINRASGNHDGVALMRWGL